MSGWWIIASRTGELIEFVAHEDGYFMDVLDMAEAWEELTGEIMYTQEGDENGPFSDVRTMSDDLREQKRIADREMDAHEADRRGPVPLCEHGVPMCEHEPDVFASVRGHDGPPLMRCASHAGDVWCQPKVVAT